MTVDYLELYKIPQTKYSLERIRLPEVRIVNGREFPAAFQLNLNGEEYDNSKVHELLKKFSESGTFTKLIEDHGAVVLRDLVESSDDSKAGEIADLIKTVESNRGHVEFPQNGTLTTRTRVGHNLYTANKKASPDSRLLQHNEYSRFKKFPVTLVFTILDYTAEGGETPLVHGAELYNYAIKELPNFVEKLSKEGLAFRRDFWPKIATKERPALWNHEVTFGRNIKPEDSLEVQKQKVEEIAKEYISDNFQWTPEDDLIIDSYAKAVKAFKGEPLIFSSIPAFASRYDPKDPSITFGNGDKFDFEDLTKFLSITDKLEYKHNWKSGDIAFIHNYQVSHGKLPFRGGKRSTEVGMWDEAQPNRSLQFVDYVV
ncbi:hypothetical protein WICMUC_004405 [Wickerhamomyces mucosus]|uniref:TauD/TfdA-like domain-containing protein n=1 Tax=Wickerhamomyces mucosus TaxID=1378264 RepID=A0A9P8PHN8_9ASCO|nr:hypothetical protein WICMUC_004405 [Wickerhamomyces mucosus]